MAPGRLGFSRCGAWALEHRLQVVVVPLGLVALKPLLDHMSVNLLNCVCDSWWLRIFNNLGVSVKLQHISLLLSTDYLLDTELGLGHLCYISVLFSALAGFGQTLNSLRI